MVFARSGRLFCLLAALLAASPALAQSAPGGAKLGSPVLAAPDTAAQPDPGNLFSVDAQPGDLLTFSVVGALSGNLWGDQIYTSDSTLAVAAVHGGWLAPGESGIVTVEIVKGLDAYEGSEANGVISRSYGAWDTAYRIVGVQPDAAPVVLPDPGNLSRHRGETGAVLRFEVVGDPAGSVWGDGVYTDDSALAAAVVHAGALAAGETGVVLVEILAGQESYGAAERNGVISNSYGAWQGSFRVLGAVSEGGKTKLNNAVRR
jgi:hypothetical protein